MEGDLFAESERVLVFEERGECAFFLEESRELRDARAPLSPRKALDQSAVARVAALEGFRALASEPLERSR